MSTPMINPSGFGNLTLSGNAIGVPGEVGIESTTMRPLGLQALGSPSIALPPGAVALTPEALMAFLEKNLNDIDAQIRLRMDTVQTNRARMNELASVATELNNIRENAGNLDDGNADYVRGLLDELAASANSPEAAAAFAQARDEIYGANDLNSGQRDSMLQTAVERIENTIDEIKGSTEMDMIKLQAWMQERSRLTSFTSNVMNAINEPIKNTVANLGRV